MRIPNYDSGNAATFSNANGVSFGFSGDTITASVGSGATATGNLGAIAFNAATTYTSGTVVFSDSNNLNWGTNGQTVTLSLAPMTVFGFNGGTTTVFVGGTQNGMRFGNAGNISFSLGQDIATSNIANIDGYSPTFCVKTGTRFTPINQPAVTVQFTNGFAGYSQNVNWNLATAANGGTISAWVPINTVCLWPPVCPNLSVSNCSANGSISVNAGTAGTTTCTATVIPYPIPCVISANGLSFFGSFSTIAGTGSGTWGMDIALYSSNTIVNTFSNAPAAVDLGFFQVFISQNSQTAQTWKWTYGNQNQGTMTGSTAGNVSSLMTNVAGLPVMGGTIPSFGFGPTIPAGDYVMVFGVSSSTVGVNLCSFQLECINNSNTTVQGLSFGSPGSVAPYHNIGLWSFTTAQNSAAGGAVSLAVSVGNFLPTSFATNALTNTGGSSQWRMPYVQFQQTS